MLLGDIVELRHGPMPAAIAAAEPVMRELGGALGAGSEVVLVPGNHDHHLLTPWMERRASGNADPLGLESEVDCRDEEPLAQLAGWLEPASVRAAYPGVWLRDDVYAVHGHYGDRHTTVPMFERLAAGVMARIVRESPNGPQRAEDYEAVLAPIYAWVHAVAQTGGPRLGESSHGVSARAWRLLAGTDARRSLRERAFVAAFPAIVEGLNLARLGPLGSDVSGPELRRASLRALAEALRRLGVAAAHVVFGHTHRAGPLRGDDLCEWAGHGGTRLTGSGSWIHEPAFLGPVPADSPYRAGFAVAIEDRDPPAVSNLLDEVTRGRA